MLVRVADLIEAEGRSLRGGAFRLSCGVAMIVVATASIIAGLALGLWGMYLAIAAQAGPPVGAALVGAVALIAGGLVAWAAHRLVAR